MGTLLVDLKAQPARPPDEEVNYLPRPGNLVVKRSPNPVRIATNESMKIIHFADLHLGVETYGRPDPTTGLSSRMNDFLAAFDQVVDYVTYVFVPAYAIMTSGLLLPG